MNNNHFLAWELWSIYNSNESQADKLQQLTLIWLYLALKTIRRNHKYYESKEPTITEIKDLQQDIHNNIDFLEHQGKEINAIIENHLIQTYKDVYNSACKHLNAYHYNMPSYEELKKLVSEVWVGEKNFKERTFWNLRQVHKAYVEILKNEKLTHEEREKALEKLQQNYWYRLHRLIRTETMHIFFKASMKAYSESGVKFVRWITTMDEKTCPICWRRDLRVYPIDLCPKYPDHPFCRCVLIPYVKRKKGINRAVKGTYKRVEL